MTFEEVVNDFLKSGGGDDEVVVNSKGDKLIKVKLQWKKKRSFKISNRDRVINS